jgi:protein kinase-like protein
VRVIGDRYELAERIGGGGMADVFRAHDRTLDRDVAVKVMREAFADVPEFVERFHREAEALASIEHPNIVSVLDYGASPDGPFIVMEYVSGGTLRDLMRARGRVDQYAAAEIVAGIADGLEAAHLRGVLHRDLKPDNVLLDGEGRPKIADFGIARLAAATAITRTGELLGTPQYLSPEQMSGDVVDERADVYALGVILYEMLTGAQPTGGTTPSEIVSRRLRVDPRPPSRLVALAPALNALVLRALARDPVRRIRRAADLREALLAIKPPAPAAPSPARAVRLRWPSSATILASSATIAALVHAATGRVRQMARFRLALPVIRLPAPPPAPVVKLRLPSAAPVVAAFAELAALLRDFGGRVRHVASLRVALPVISLPPLPHVPVMPRTPVVRIRWPSLAPLAAAFAVFAATIGGQARDIRRRVAVVASRPLSPPVTTPIRVGSPRRRSAGPLAAVLALLVAVLGGSLILAGPRQIAVAPMATAPPAATAAVLASTSTPAPSTPPQPTIEPTPEPTTAPTLAPPVVPMPVAVVATPIEGDPAGTIVTFYQLISGHDYVSASGLWSDRMRASYPPQTNIWGRFDATRSIVARSTALTSANPGSATVAVDLIETRTDGSVRRWVGTWYLVRSGPGWLLDQPGLRAG